MRNGGVLFTKGILLGPRRTPKRARVLKRMEIRGQTLEDNGVRLDFDTEWMGSPSTMGDEIPVTNSDASVKGAVTVTIHDAKALNGLTGMGIR